MRAVLVLLSILIVAFIGVGAYFMLSTPTADESDPFSDVIDFFAGTRDPIGNMQGEGDITPSQTVYSGLSTSTYKTAEGEDVVLVKNMTPPETFTSDKKVSSEAEQSEDHANLLLVAYAHNQNGSPRFEVYYDADINLFVMVLGSEPIAKVRLEAEQAMLEILRIPKKETCDLPHYVGTPSYVNSFFAHKNLGFSFCPASTIL